MKRSTNPVAVAVVLLLGGVGYFAYTAAERRQMERRAAEWRFATQPAPPPATGAKPHAAALDLGVAFLLKQQSPDGAWRSDVYGTFKDGTALTPLVVCALQEAADPGAADAVRKGSEFLAKLIAPDGTITVEGGLDYPVYTAALAVVALSHPDNKPHAAARDRWLKYLLARQLTEPLGWKPEDKEFGGWGYCRAIPVKPEAGKFAPPLVESNLSATVFALEALRAAGVADAAVYEKVAAFVRRCQNDDGGFHFIYDDPVRNKAGAAEQPDGRPARFHSYGSTTADGWRALVLCGVPADDESRVKARLWVWKNFRADSHPGVYVAAHERNRDAVYFYYAASTARALRRSDIKQVEGVDWAAALSAELAKRQKDDGSWANPVELVRENDPIVATASAVIALANCKRAAK